MEVRPGYWDYERCAWVGFDPTYLLPSLHDETVAGVAIPEPSVSPENAAYGVPPAAPGTERTLA